MTLQFWEFLAGLGLFLFAMRTIETALRQLSTRTFRHFIRDHTRTPIHGVAVGVLSTICLQSSSLVGLILLAFVGAGIIHFRNALGIIYGANLGTTFTGWLVATIGFKLDLGGYALAPLAVGALVHVFVHPDKRNHHYGSLLLGLGLLLLGLDWMKAGMETLALQVDDQYFRDYPILVYFAAGVIFTALIQSSSATMAVILSALYSDLIPLHTAAAIAIGSDLGTTSTVLLGGISGRIGRVADSNRQRTGSSPDKKRVALSHLMFNVITDVLALILLTPLLFIVQRILGIADPLFALVAFHSLFNLLGIALFLPLTNTFSRWLEARFQAQPVQHCQHIHQTSSHVPEAALSAITTDIRDMLRSAASLNLRVLNLSTDALQAHGVSLPKQQHAYRDSYSELKRQEEELQTYAQQLATETLDENEKATLNKLLSAVRNIVYSAKSLKDVHHNFIDFHQLPEEPLSRALREDTERFYSHLFSYLENQTEEAADETPHLLNRQIAESHERLHQLMRDRARARQEEFSLSTLLNMNRELFVSNQSLAEAAYLLRNQPQNSLAD